MIAAPLGSGAGNLACSPTSISCIDIALPAIFAFSSNKRENKIEEDIILLALYQIELSQPCGANGI